MPIYCYKCNECGKEISIQRPMKESNHYPICDHGTHLQFMYRDFNSEGCNFGFGNGNLCRASTGYARNAEDAEEEMKKRGLPVGHWVGKYPKDMQKKIKRRLKRGRKKQPKYFNANITTAN